MAHIEASKFPLVGASDTIFTTHLNVNPTVTNSIIQNIKDGGDKQKRESNVKACIMTDWKMQHEPGFIELEKEITDIINTSRIFLK